MITDVSSSMDQKLRNLWEYFIVSLLILLLAPLVFMTTSNVLIELVAIMALAWFLPGMLLVAHWRLPNLDWIAAGLLASGLGICWMILVILILYWLPGGINRWQLVAAYEIGALSLLVALWWHPPLPLKTTKRSVWVLMLLCLLIVIPLRLPGLGYHEFHVDETFVLNRAKQAIEGDEDPFARHAKGAGELAMATLIYRALDTVDERSARLPFGVASILSVLVTAWLGYRLFSLNVGFWAGVLLSVNGFALGLSRIVQYQAVVLLLSALAVLTAWEFRQRGNARWLALTGVFSTFGIIMHYEFGLLAPALLFLAWKGWQQATDKRSVLAVILTVGLPCALLVAATYVPILQNRYFEKTVSNYLSIRMGDGRSFNLPFFIEISTFYNSTYFLIGLILLVLAGLIIGWRNTRQRVLLLFLWFMPFFILHFFIVTFPGTHFYLMMESWSLLAALPLAALIAPFQTDTVYLRPYVQSRYLQAAILSVIITWLVISVGYLYLIFFRQVPEYVINYEQARIPFYWAPYGKNIPKKPRFGFPILEGWKTLGVLNKWGYLEGTYASNEYSRHLRWYLNDFDRDDFDENPDFIFVAIHQQEADPAFNKSILEAEGYQQVGEVRVRGTPRIALYARQAASYVTYDAEQFLALFDALVPVLQPLDELDRAFQGLEEGLTLSPSISDFALDEHITLESASISESNLQRGDTLLLQMVWHTKKQLDNNYKIFVHVGSGSSGQPLTQWDGHPGLNNKRSTEWRIDQPFTDHILLTIPEEMPFGDHTILIGLYDEITGERAGGQAIPIGSITVR